MSISYTTFASSIIQYNDCIDTLDSVKDLHYKECKCKWLYLARRMREEPTIITAPSPSELPMPPLKWLKQEPKYDLSLLDWATEQAIEHHWKGQVKACQYAIFHMC